MAQYIDKNALVAEIERRIRELEPFRTEDNLRAHGAITGYYQVLSFIDTLEVKEVDLDEVKIGETQIFIEDDGGEPPYDGNQWLDLGCLEYEIPENKFKDGDNVEIIIRKTQKEYEDNQDTHN